MQDIIVTDEKNENIQQGIRATAGRIPEGLYGHQLSERRVKEINKRNDLLFWHIILKFPREGNIKGLK